MNRIAWHYYLSYFVFVAVEMSPIARSAVKFTQKIKNPAVRSLTLTMIEEATKYSDLAHFTNATLKNPSHTSHSDSKPHVTALLSTDAQVAADKSQTVHIYHDQAGKYTGHTLYEERDNKQSD